MIVLSLRPCIYYKTRTFSQQSQQPTCDVPILSVSRMGVKSLDSIHGDIETLTTIQFGQFQAYDQCFIL